MAHRFMSAHPQVLLSARFARGAAPALQGEQSPMQRERMARFAARFVADRDAFERTACVCGAQDATQIAEVERYGLPLDTVCCARCGTLRFDPHLNAAALAAFYAEDYQKLYQRADDVAAYFERQRAYGRRVLTSLRHRLPPGAAVLEVGCGAGGGLSPFHDAGMRVSGVDFDAGQIDYARQHVPGRFELLTGDDDQRLPEGCFDLILAHHVLEHLHDPVAQLQLWRRWLAPGGVICVAVPDVSRIDRYLASGGDLLPFLHVAHRYNFSADGLVHLAARCGLVAQAFVPRNMPTHCSMHPEHWLLLRAGTSARPPAESGASMLARLRQIEANFLAGRTLAQRGARWRTRWRRLWSWASRSTA
jgi:SAM-dependent methyltransferase